MQLPTPRFAQQGAARPRNHEAVIKIPAGCLGILAEPARQMRLFESEAHELLRSRSIPAAQKRQKVGDLPRKFAFAAPA